MGTVLTDGRQRADHLLEVGTQIRFSVISWTQQSPDIQTLVRLAY